MASTVNVTEGRIPFTVASAGKPCETWYKLFGDLTTNNPSLTPPLIVLHGGPGSTSDYLSTISDLALSYSHRPVIIYDQLGNGNSTHLPEKRGDTTFWTEQLFLDELHNVLTYLGVGGSYDLLGHSWGGMLGARHASLQPAGLRKLVISSSPADMKVWAAEQKKLRRLLPEEVQQTLLKHEKAGTVQSKEYEEAVNVFYRRHLCRKEPLPMNMLKTMGWMEKDPTVYLTMNGPSEFHVIGSLKDWSILDDAHKISVPTLLLNGKYDEATDATVMPFFKNIPHVKWVTFANSSHTAQLEERERYMEVVETFLAD